MTEKQFNALIEMHHLTVSNQSRIEAKLFVVMEMCLRTMEQVSGSKFTPAEIDAFTKGLFDDNHAFLKETIYQPAIDRAAAEYRGG